MNAVNSHRLAGFVERHTDIAVGLVLLAVLCLLLLPLPFFLIDLAIAANFAFTILLLCVTLYLRGILELSVFPSLLLLTTLFRLGLSVATTKMILLHANAGEMVHTFGSLVVGGDVIVGLVIFVLLTVVQFMVVAKGGDRIAEVAARFTLDAIPGKQMSIDADLRAGSINAAQAAARRETMQREIQLYGALDGAMKFVKGDAIIGLVIALVNIIGGISVGMLMKKMPFGEAVNTYVILTVGDGLVSQIPSLLVAIAAGLLITRVSNEDAGDGKPAHLGQSIYVQIIGKPSAIVMAAIAAVVFAVVPGFPHWQFFVLAGMLLVLYVAQKSRASLRQIAMTNLRRDGTIHVPELLDSIELGTKSPLLVRVGKQAFAALDLTALNVALGVIRKKLTETYGLPFPGMTIVGEVDFEVTRYAIEVHGIVVMEGHMMPSTVLVHGRPEQLEKFRNDRPGSFPGSLEAYWIEAAQEQDAGRAGLNTAAPHDVLAEQVYALCKQHAVEFMGAQEAQYLLNRLATSCPDLVEALQKKVSAAQLASLLADLLKEGISIRNFKIICDIIVRYATENFNQAKILSELRIALGKYFVAQYVDHVTQQMSALVVDADWEEALRDGLRQNMDGVVELALPFRDMQALQHALGQHLQQLDPSIVVLTACDIRKPVWHIVQSLSPGRAVLGFDELPVPRPHIVQVAIMSMAQ